MSNAPRTGRPQKRPIPDAVKREVCRRYGASPGRSVDIACHYCAAPARIEWATEYAAWPHYGRWDLRFEMDHVVPEHLGGPTSADNIVIACQPCNRRKGWRLTAAEARRNGQGA